MSPGKKILTEVVQFIPIVTLASSFIIKGGVDLSSAGTLFAVSAALAVGITAWLVSIKITLNPILLASNMWLIFGAVAFGISVTPLAHLLEQTNAVLLFAAVTALGIFQMATKSKTGFIGMEKADAYTIRKLSFTLLGLSFVALIWAWGFKDNIRLGGGLPFIFLNIARRVMMKRAIKQMHRKVAG